MKQPYRSLYKILLVAYVVAVVWTSVAYAIDNRRAVSPIVYSVPRIKVILPPRGKVSSYILTAARAEGVDPRVAEWIVAHESSHRPEATGDGGESRGLWQINKAWHPEVSDQCAYDVRCSTRWSLERIRAGYATEWSTWKYCKSRFEDCPF